MRKKNLADINFGCRTDIGQVREHNEDSLLAQAPLFVVADGMGGHAAGEVGSDSADIGQDTVSKRHLDWLPPLHWLSKGRCVAPMSPEGS